MLAFAIEPAHDPPTVAFKPGTGVEAQGAGVGRGGWQRRSTSLTQLCDKSVLVDVRVALTPDGRAIWWAQQGSNLRPAD